MTASAKHSNRHPVTVEFMIFVVSALTSAKIREVIQPRERGEGFFFQRPATRWCRDRRESLRRRETLCCDRSHRPSLALIFIPLTRAVGLQRDPLAPPAGRPSQFLFSLIGATMELGRSWRTLLMMMLLLRPGGAGELRGHRQQAALNGQRFRASRRRSPRRHRPDGCRRETRCGARAAGRHCARPPNCVSTTCRFSRFIKHSRCWARPTIVPARPSKHICFAQPSLHAFRHVNGGGGRFLALFLKTGKQGDFPRKTGRRLSTNRAIAQRIEGLT